MTLATIAGSFCLLLLGVFIIKEALQLDYSSDYGPGPGFLPLWIGIVITTLSAVLIAMSILPQRKNRGKQAVTWQPMGRALITWGILMVAIGLLNPLGFLGTFTLLSLVLSLVLDRTGPAIAMIVALCGALGFYLIFVFALGLPLPRGPLGF